jgi:STE24 endopeptidase
LIWCPRLLGWWPRFEADAFASSHARSGELATALVKLHRDNASTLTADPVYAAFYYSHPPPLTGISRLREAAAVP